jgi:hypothetical protein
MSGLWVAINTMRILSVWQMLRVFSAPKDGVVYEPSWVYDVSITFNDDTAEEVAAYSRIDEGDADLLAQDQRVSARCESELTFGARVIVQRPSTSTLAAIKVTEPAEDGLSSVVLVDSKSRAAKSTFSRAAVLSVAPAPTSAQAGHPVHAIYPDASGSHRLWFYRVMSGVLRCGELVNVEFDDSSSDTLAVYNVQDRSPNSSSRGA